MGFLAFIIEAPNILSLSLSLYIYIYIYRKRERKFVYIYHDQGGEKTLQDVKRFSVHNFTQAEKNKTYDMLPN